MLDWEFDDLIEVVHDIMEAHDDREDKASIMTICFENLEEEMKKGEVEKLLILLVTFYEQLKYLEMEKDYYILIEEMVEKYQKNKNINLTSYQKNKIENFINFFENFQEKMILCDYDGKGNILYYRLKIKEDGCKILEKIEEVETVEENISNDKGRNPELIEFISICKKIKEFDNIRFTELLRGVEDLTLETNREKLELLFEINNNMWNFPYSEIRDKESNMNLDGRYERNQILKRLIKNFKIDSSEIINNKNIKEVKEELKIFDLSAEITRSDFIVLYNLINSFYNEMLERTCTEKYYIWNDYKNKLSKNKIEGLEEEYRKLLRINEGEKKKEIEEFDNILKSIGLL